MCTFWQHGRQGVPLKDLREELEEEGLTESIAPERLDELLRRADQDGDKRIRLGEFVRMVSGSSNRYGLIYSLSIIIVHLIDNLYPFQVNIL